MAASHGKKRSKPAVFFMTRILLVSVSIQTTNAFFSSSFQRKSPLSNIHRLNYQKNTNDDENCLMHESVWEQDPDWYEQYVVDILGKEYCQSKWPISMDEDKRNKNRQRRKEQEKLKSEIGTTVKAEEVEARVRAEESKAKEARRKAEEEAKAKSDEKRMNAEHEAKLKAEAAKLKAKEEAKLKTEEEKRLKAEEEAKSKAEAAKLKAEEEAKLKTEEKKRLKTEEEAKSKSEEAKLKAEKEARLKAEEEAKEAEKKARLKADNEARLKAEKEARLKAKEEARLKAEKEARLRAEETRLKAVEIAKEEARLNEEEARAKAEEEARLKAQKEVALKAENEAARLKAEVDARQKAKSTAEQEVKEKAEKETQLKTEDDTKVEAEKEIKPTAEEQVNAVESKANSPPSVLEEGKDSTRVVVFRNMGDAMTSIPLANITKLGYRPEEIQMMQSDALAVIVSDDIPRPRMGVPPQWKTPKNQPSPDIQIVNSLKEARELVESDKVEKREQRNVEIASTKTGRSSESDIQGKTSSRDLLVDGRPPRRQNDELESDGRVKSRTLSDKDEEDPAFLDRPSRRQSFDRPVEGAERRPSPDKAANGTAEKTIVRNDEDDVDKRRNFSENRRPQSHRRRSVNEDGSPKRIYNAREPPNRKKAPVQADPPPLNSPVWMDMDTFRKLLRSEAELRLRILGDDWAPTVKQESDWRLNLYKNWLWTLHDGVGDSIVPPSRYERARNMRDKRERSDEERDDMKSSRKKIPPNRRRRKENDRRRK